MAEAAVAQDFYFNPWDQSYRANPYPHYAPLLSGPPRVIDLMGPFALIARFADVRATLIDHATFSSRPPKTPAFAEQYEMFGGENMLTSDPPMHTRLRRLISRDFTPKRIRGLRPRVDAITNDLLDAVARKGELDVMADIANVLPVMVIAEMLGVSTQDYRRFKTWSNKVIEADNAPPGMPIPDDIKTAFRELNDYLRAEIEKRRRTPGSDLISALVSARDKTDALSESELLQFVVLLLLAGNETTTNLIGNGMLALGRHSDQMAMLRKNPDLLPRAIDEMLRYDGPVQSTFRTATRDCNVGGTDIKAGTGAFVILAAGNRDPAQFPNADRFDITRDSRDHLAFGDGIHYCIGAPLARMEGAAAVGGLLRRFERLRLAKPDAPLKYKGSFFLRGLVQLDMAIS